MKHLVLIILTVFLVGNNQAQKMDAKAINKKITEIRQNTNWDNPEAAKAANEDIKKLSKQLLLAKQKVNTENPSKIDEIKQENIESNQKLWNQMMKSFEEGKNADLLLGKPIQEEIVEEYKNDESPIIKNPEIFEQLTVLVIDMTLKTVQRTIDQMDKFKSIQTLIISGGDYGAPVNLGELLKKAKDYPLEELYIINFKNNVKTLPAEISKFNKLVLLSVFGNNLTSLPKAISSFVSLKSLYVDLNPISSILPVVGNLKALENLGVGKTKIPQTELDKIAKQLPNCKILLK